MNKIKIYIAVAYLSMSSGLTACHQKYGPIIEVKQDSLTVQLRRMPTEPGDIGTVGYIVRLIPSKGLFKNITQSMQTALIYHIDSCFKLLQGGNKIYPNLVQPIANGQKGNYEYLLSFQISDLKKCDWTLFYQDEYLNHKMYKISLN